MILDLEWKKTFHYKFFSKFVWQFCQYYWILWISGHSIENNNLNFFKFLVEEEQIFWTSVSKNMKLLFIKGLYPLNWVNESNLSGGLE